MKIYSVTHDTGDFDRNPKSWNLTEHDSDAATDPTNQKPIGRKFLARGLTADEATRLKRDCDLHQGTHPLQFNPRNPIPEDAKPSTATIFLPNGQKAKS